MTDFVHKYAECLDAQLTEALNEARSHNHVQMAHRIETLRCKPADDPAKISSKDASITMGKLDALSCELLQELESSKSSTLANQGILALVVSSNHLEIIQGRIFRRLGTRLSFPAVQIEPLRKSSSDSGRRAAAPYQRF